MHVAITNKSYFTRDAKKNKKLGQQSSSLAFVVDNDIEYEIKLKNSIS